MIKQNYKKYKFNQLQKIKKTYKYIYIFRYNDLTINENILLKKNLKKLKFQSLILKQNLIKTFFKNIEGQGSVLIIYSNENFNLIKELNHFYKIELIYLIINNFVFSNLKLKKIFSKNKLHLNVSIIKPFLNFLFYLKKIEKANIT